jgi:hypothetical protein
LDHVKIFDLHSTGKSFFSPENFFGMSKLSSGAMTQHFFGRNMFVAGVLAQYFRGPFLTSPAGTNFDPRGEVIPWG